MVVASTTLLTLVLTVPQLVIVLTIFKTLYHHTCNDTGMRG